jgi:Na+-transporting NADH:ubiquinone oxidoreductase subunit D
MSAAKAKPTVRALAVEGLWTNNPVFCQVLGICSTLAVTNLVLNTLVMCVALTFTVALTSWTVSALRDWTPRKVPMMVEVLIMAFYVIVVDQLLRAYWPEMSASLGPYVGLIITNCILMGRAEACAISATPGHAFWDGLFNGVGYSLVLLVIAVLREVLGMGTVLGFPVPFFSGPAWDKWIVMVMPPGAFFVLAAVVWALRSIQRKEEAT